ALTVLYVAGVPFAYWRQGALDTLTDSWLKTLIIFILVTQTVFSIERVRKLVWAIILCELLVSGASVLNPEAARGAEQGTRMEGITTGFLSGNYLGIAAATTLPFIAALLIRTKSPFKRIALITTFGMMLWMVILTASRASILAVIFSLVLVWI